MRVIFVLRQSPSATRPLPEHESFGGCAGSWDGVAFASPDRLSEDFGPTVLGQPLFVIGAQTGRRKRNAIGSQLVGDGTFRREPVLFELLPHQLFGSDRFAATLDQKA